MKRCIPLSVKTYSQAMGLALILALAGCATPEVIPPSERELDRASHTMLREAVYTNTLLDHCGKVHPDLARLTGELRERWLDQNGDYLAAADEHYSQSLARETIRYKDHTLALTAVQLSHRQQARASEELRLERRSQTNRQIFCERRLGEMAENLREITPDMGDRSRLVVDTLISLYPQAGASLDTVPSLAYHIPPNQEPGRSYYEQAELALKDCPDSDLKVIHNDWPFEAYGAYCETIPFTFIECEWGECEHQ